MDRLLDELDRGDIGHREKERQRRQRHEERLEAYERDKQAQYQQDQYQPNQHGPQIGRVLPGPTSKVEPDITIPPPRLQPPES